MKVTFLGASSGIVTGSSYLLELDRLKMLVDCGFFQGEPEVEAKNEEPFSFDPAELKYVLLTHAHLDHTGLLPKLVKDGFRGRIIATDATRALTELILLDAAKIQEEEAKHRIPDAEGRHQGKTLLYNRDDVAALMELFQIHSYGETVRLSDSFSFRMREAGHILGSVTYELWFKNAQGRERKMVFSGDLGQTGSRIIRDPDFIREADYIVMESTYGSRNHRDKNSTLLEMLGVFTQAAREKGRILIPSFAVERTQEILYEINQFVEKGVLTGLNYFVDSPLAIKATEVFRTYRKYYDEDALALVKNGDDPFMFKGLEYVENVYESKRISTENSAVIIAGSGMCTGGRILSHLANGLPERNTHVVFVGFQVPGTLGRRIIDGSPMVRIYGNEVPVHAQVHTLNGFSAHADQNDLLYWLRSFGHSPKEVFITHGDTPNREGLHKKVQEELQMNTILPELKQSFELD